MLGLDGVPHSLLELLIAEGAMPALGQLAAVQDLRRMQVTLPEISAVSWTSFMTGVDPGTHGIFGFSDLKPGSREMRFPSFHDVKAPTLWDRLSEQGGCSCVINQPATYPARPLQGALVSGFVALELHRAVYPLRHLAALRRMNYELDIDTQRSRRDRAYLMQALDSSLEGRRRALDYFWDAEDWDYFQLVITGADRLQHYAWNAIVDETDPLHQAARGYFRKVDALIGEVVERFQQKTNCADELPGLFLMSDHGFTAIKKEFRLNTWLEREGYLVAGPGQPELATLSPATKAFALDPNRIYLNRQDRFPDGTVAPDETERVLDELSEQLLGLRCGDEPVVRRVARGRDIYTGPQTAHGPDLIALTHYGYDAKGVLGAAEVFADTDLQGMHTFDDAFLWTTADAPAEPQITDLRPLIEAVLYE